MTYEEYKKARYYIETKALALMKHEGRAFAKAGLPINNYNKHEVGGREFYTVRTNVFKAIIDSVYLEAHDKFPERFGTGNADDILKAIFDVEPIFDFDNFPNFLQNEQFAYAIENKKGEVEEKVLRIDLFRQLDLKDDTKKEFTGGIFHVLKHFSHKGKNLSTGSQIYDISSLETIIELAIKAFFVSDGHFETASKYVSTIDYNDDHKFKFVFYLEENTKVFFIKTIHQIGK